MNGFAPVRWLGAFGIAAVIAAFLGPAARADTFTVTKRGDPVPGQCTSSDCSLREAILRANANLGEADVIVLPSRRVYQLSQPGGDDGALMGDLDINNDPLRIVHPGRGQAVIDGGNFDRIFEVFTGAPTTLRRLVVTNGDDPHNDSGNGGGIRSMATLRLIRSVVRGNESTSGGGGIHTQDGAKLVLRHSRVSGNKAINDGGGISHSSLGGAGALTMVGSAIVGNTADADNNGIGRGGGVYLQTAGGVQSVISRSTISDNRAGDEGGGIYTDLGRLRMVATTLDGNRSGTSGGGISVDGTQPLVVVNSTVTKNSSESVGGGIHGDAGRILLNVVTVARNRGNSDGMLSEAGGGLYVNDIPFRVENSLIALNTLTALVPGDPPVANDCAGVGGFDSAGHNLLSTRFLCDGFDRPSDRVRSNPKIGQLQDNGGPTKTITLRRGSPAIDEAKPSTAPDVDQRGRRRDRKPDIGAYERL